MLEAELGVHVTCEKNEQDLWDGTPPEGEVECLHRDISIKLRVQSVLNREEQSLIADYRAGIQGFWGESGKEKEREGLRKKEMRT